MSNEIVTIKRGDPPFVVEAMQTMEGMMKYAEMIIASGLAPKHFLGRPEAIVLAAQLGTSIGLTVAQSLQSINVVNGMTGIKGDTAKALINASGKQEVWKETITGTIAGGDYQMSIYSKRKDTKEEQTVVFSMFHAKRAGLWVTDADVKKDSRKGYGPWYKYPERMIRYRALGFLCRDLYGDILGGECTQKKRLKTL